MAIKHKATKCRICKNDAALTEVFTTTLVKPNDATDPPNNFKVPFTSALTPGVEHLVEVIQVSDTNLESEPGTLLFTPNGAMIQPPVIYSPTINTTIPNGSSLQIELGAFLTTPEGAATHKSTEYLISASPAFGTTVYSQTLETNLRSLTVSGGIFQPNTTYYIKVAFHSENMVSPYSEVVSFKTGSASADVATPTLTTPSVGTLIDCKSFALVTSTFSKINPAVGDHTSTIWQVSKNNLFSSFVYNQETVANKTNITIPGNLLTPGTTYFVKFKYKAGTYESPWSETYQIKTQLVQATYISKPAPPTGTSAIGALHWIRENGAAALLGLNFLDGTSDGSSGYFNAFGLGTSAWTKNTVSGSSISSELAKILQQDLNTKCAFVADEPYFTYITTEKLFLDSGAVLSLSVSGDVYGAGTEEKVVLQTGATNVSVDQNVEVVGFPGASSSYQYQQSGNVLIVYSGNDLIGRVSCQGDANGTVIAFSDGFVYCKLTVGVMTLGDQTVTTTKSALTIGGLDTQALYSLATLNAAVTRTVSSTQQVHVCGKLVNGVFAEIARATTALTEFDYVIKGNDATYVYAFSGTVPLRTFKRYNTAVTPLNHAWDSLASLPADCEVESKLISYGNFLYGYGYKTVNGNKLSALFTYNKSGNSWLVEEHATTEFFFRKDPAVEIVGDFMYVHGGRHHLTNLANNELWRFSFILGQWSQMTSGGETTSKHVAYSKSMFLHLVGNSMYSIDCAAIGGSCVTIEDPDAVIGAPVIQSPSEGQMLPLETGSISVQLSEFVVSPVGGDTHKSTKYQFFDTANVESATPILDIDTPTFLRSYVPLASSFQANKTYYVRAQFVGNNATSPWSSVRSFKTSFKYNNPQISRIGTVYAPAGEGLSGTIAYEHDPIAGLDIQVNPLSTVPAGATPHVKTIWQVAKNGDFNNGMLYQSAPTSGDSLVKCIVPAANFGSNYDTNITVRVQFNDNGLWSEVVTFKTKPAKGWATVLTYIDNVQTLAAGTLATIRRYRCIGRRSKASPSSDGALFVFGSDGQSGATWLGKEFPMDGSTGRVIKTDVIDYCNFVYCDGYIYRIRFKSDGLNAAQIHRMVLSSDMNAVLDSWEQVSISSLIAGKNYNENISIMVSRNRIIIYAREEALINGIPRIAMFLITPANSASNQVTKAEIDYTDYPNSYFKVDNVVSIARDSDAPSTEKCLLARVKPGTLDPHPGEKGYAVTLSKYEHNIYNMAAISNVYDSAVTEPHSGWNVVFDPTNNIIYYNSLSFSNYVTLVDPASLTSGSTMNGIGPITNPGNPSFDTMYKVILQHYHGDMNTRSGLYSFGARVTSLNTNQFYLKRFT